MFLTPGWAHFVAEIETALGELQIDKIGSTEQFWMAKGRAAAFMQMLAFEETTKMVEELDYAEDI